MAALTYQSQLTASTAATMVQCQEMQLAHLARAQDTTHATLHQIIKGLNNMAFNVSNTGRGIGRFGGRGGVVVTLKAVVVFKAMDRSPPMQVLDQLQVSDQCSTMVGPSLVDFHARRPAPLACQVDSRVMPHAVSLHTVLPQLLG